MNRLAGQAGSTLARFSIAAGMAVMTVFFIAVLAAGGLAYRLSLGPLQIPWAATRLANAVSGEDVAVRIGRAELTWSGYKSGSRAPFFLQLGNIELRNTNGALLATIPQAQLAFSLRALFSKHAPIYVSGQGAQVMDSNAPVSLLAGIRLGTGFTLSSADLFVTFGAGRLGPPGYDEPLIGGKFQLTITPSDVRLDHAILMLQPVGRSAPVLQITAAGHKKGTWHGTITLSAASVQAADMAHYWPSQLAVTTRNWVIRNITAGTAQDARFTLGLAAPLHLAALRVNSATGGFKAENATLIWLPGVQPLTGLTGKFTLTDRDHIDIEADTGHLGGIALAAAAMHISGVSKKNQLASLTIPLRGTVETALAILNGPGLGLLKTVPPPVSAATGDMTATVNVKLPLQNNISPADVHMNVAARLSNVTLPLPVQGLRLQQGSFTVDSTLRTLSVKGKASLAGQPATLAVAADFGAAAVTFDMSTTATEATLQDGGLDTGGLIQGAMPVALHVATTAATGGNLTVDADLSGAALALPIFGWEKPAGAPGHFSFAASLSSGNFAAIDRIDRIAAKAPGLDVESTMQGKAIDLTYARIGNTAGSGRIVPPAGNQPWIITLRGTALDLSSVVNPPHETAQATPKTTPKAETNAAEPQPPNRFPWRASLQFGRLLLAKSPAPELQDFTFDGAGQGSFLLQANAAAEVAGATAAPLTLMVTPAPLSLKGDSEILALHAADAGTLLRAMGAFQNLQSGKLDLFTRYGVAAPAEGVIKISHFRLLNAPAIGKILQAITVLGIPEAASGPGLQFNRLVVPFAVDDAVITLKGARAYSASLGFTASGTIDQNTDTYDIHGTVVPAYALNSLPGKIPLIGKLFSPEKGGGLFAMRYSMKGPISDPKLTINPLSALTPGFLRGIFGSK